MTRLREYPLPEAAAVAAAALVLGSVGGGLTRPRPILPPLGAQVGAPTAPAPAESSPGRWSDTAPSDYGLFEGREKSVEGAAECVEPHPEPGARLRLVGVVGTPPDCTGLFAITGTPEVRSVSGGEALSELDLLVVAFRAGERDGGPVAVLRRLGDGRLFELPLATGIISAGEAAR